MSTWNNIVNLFNDGSGGHNDAGSIERDVQNLVNDSTNGDALHQLQLDVLRIRQDPSVIGKLNQQLSDHDIQIDNDGSINFIEYNAKNDSLSGHIGGPDQKPTLTVDKSYDTSIPNS